MLLHKMWQLKAFTCFPILLHVLYKEYNVYSMIWNALHVAIRAKVLYLDAQSGESNKEQYHNVIQHNGPAVRVHVMPALPGGRGCNEQHRVQVMEWRGRSYFIFTPHSLPNSSSALRQSTGITSRKTTSGKTYILRLCKVFCWNRFSDDSLVSNIVFTINWGFPSSSALSLTSCRGLYIRMFSAQPLEWLLAVFNVCLHRLLRFNAPPPFLHYSVSTRLLWTAKCKVLQLIRDLPRIKIKVGRSGKCSSEIIGQSRWWQADVRPHWDSGKRKDRQSERKGGLSFHLLNSGGSRIIFYSFITGDS